MMNIYIVCEPSQIDIVRPVVRRIRQNSDKVHLLCRDSFPIADSMFSFFHVLSSKFDETFIVISGKSDSILSIWISSELTMIQQSQGKFANVHPTFATVDDIQAWWVKENVFILSDI
jgi:hypothetical protein